MIETEGNRGMTVEELRATNLHGAALGQYLFDGIGELLAQGVSVDSIKARLIAYYDRLEDEGLDADQDAVADVMDSLVGSCPPTARLRA